MIVLLVLAALVVTLVTPRWSVPRLLGSVAWGLAVIEVWLLGYL